MDFRKLEIALVTAAGSIPRRCNGRRRPTRRRRPSLHRLEGIEAQEPDAIAVVSGGRERSCEGSQSSVITSSVRIGADISLSKSSQSLFAIPLGVSVNSE